MSSNSSEMIDFLYEKEDCKAAEDSLRSALFSNESHSLKMFKEELFNDDNTPFEWKSEANDFNVDELLGSCFIDNGLINTQSSLQGESQTPLTVDDIKEEDFEAFKDIVSLPFDAVINSFDPRFEAASDSGLSTDNFTDFMLSPSSGTTSPDSRIDLSVDTADTNSDVSSSSDLGSMGSVGSSPNGRNDYPVNPIRYELSSSGLSQYDDEDEDVDDEDDNDVEMKSLSVPLSCLREKNSVLLNTASFVTNQKSIITTPQFITKLSASALPSSSSSSSLANRNFKIELAHPSKIKKTIASSNKACISITNRHPILTKVHLDTNGIISPLKHNTTMKGTTPQTIVVTQAGKVNPLIRNGTFLKATTGRPILVPVNVNVNDLNQIKKMKSIKIISANNSVNRPGTTSIRTLVSTMRPVSTTANGTTSGNRTTLYTTSKDSEGRSLLKVTPTAFVTPNSHTDTSCISVTPSYIKEEPSDDEMPLPNQELVLTEEERRLMRKEGLVLPSRYPLTKQEERDLKRIRRKIRNKISAQDSRKRKKEYVDGLEDRVKNCSEENQQLQKRIKTLEKQNESLLAQLKKFQNLVGAGFNQSRPHSHTSTALMMLILSTALFVVPSLRSQDGKSENELTRDSKLSPSGHTRNLLEVKNAALKTLDGYPVTDEDALDALDYTNALSDHDYAPFAKRPRMSAINPNYFSPPSVDKTLPRETGDPPDSLGLNGVAAMIGAMFDRLGSNWTDPGGSPVNTLNLTPSHGPPDRSSVVVNLNHGKRLRDDLELE